MKEHTSTEFKHWYWSDRNEIGLTPGLMETRDLSDNDKFRVIGTLGIIEIINSYSDGLAQIKLISRSSDKVRILPKNFIELATYYFYAPFIWNNSKIENMLGFDEKIAWHVPTHDPFRQASDRTNIAILKLTDRFAEEHFGVMIPNR